MTRLWTDGAEDPAGLAVLSGYTGTAIATSPVRSGVYAYRVSGSSSMYRNFSDLSEGYFRVGWYAKSNTDVYKSVRFRNGTTELITMGLSTTDKHFRVLIGGSVVATGTFAYNTFTYYALEFRIKIDDTAGVVQLKVDGVIDIDYTGDTKPGTATAINNLLLASNNDFPDPISEMYFDDLAINDTTGTVDNSWCGDGRVIYLAPNAAGDTTQLTPSAGANYAAVDDRPHDSDSTYVEGSTVDNRDLYNLAASGLAAGSTIGRVIPIASAKDTVANGGKIKLGLKTSTTEYFGDDLTLTTGYTPQYGSQYLTNPLTGNPWTIAELDALQMGVKVRGT